MVTNKQRVEFIFAITADDPVNGQSLIEELERTGKLDEAVAEFAGLSDKLNAPAQSDSPNADAEGS